MLSEGAQNSLATHEPHAAGSRRHVLLHEMVQVRSSNQVAGCAAQLTADGIIQGTLCLGKATFCKLLCSTAWQQLSMRMAKAQHVLG
jgi:coenzyme F420-reducing hydrogenase gamma subunit